MRLINGKKIERVKKGQRNPKMYLWPWWWCDFDCIFIWFGLNTGDTFHTQYSSLATKTDYKWERNGYKIYTDNQDDDGAAFYNTTLGCVNVHYIMKSDRDNITNIVFSIVLNHQHHLKWYEDHTISILYFISENVLYVPLMITIVGLSSRMTFCASFHLSFGRHIFDDSISLQQLRFMFLLPKKYVATRNNYQQARKLVN